MSNEQSSAAEVTRMLNQSPEAVKIEHAFEALVKQSPDGLTAATVLSFLKQQAPNASCGMLKGQYDKIVVGLQNLGFKKDFKEGDLINGQKIQPANGIARATIADAIKTMEKGSFPEENSINVACDAYQNFYKSSERGCTTAQPGPHR